MLGGAILTAEKPENAAASHLGAALRLAYHAKGWDESTRAAIGMGLPNYEKHSVYDRIWEELRKLFNSSLAWLVGLKFRK